MFNFSILKNIDKVLNNENGGPNLEQLLGIAISLGMVAAARTLASGEGAAFLTPPGAYSEQSRGSFYGWIREIQKSEGQMLGVQGN